MKIYINKGAILENIFASEIVTRYIKFVNEVKVKSKFKCIICGLLIVVIKDKESDFYIIPITALKP